MQLSRLGWPRKPGDIPAEIYIPLVDSLYAEIRTLFLGSLAVSLAVLLSAWKNGSPYLYACWVILVLIATARAFAMTLYSRRRGKITTTAEARN